LKLKGIFKKEDSCSVDLKMDIIAALFEHFKNKALDSDIVHQILIISA